MHLLFKHRFPIPEPWRRESTHPPSGFTQQTGLVFDSVPVKNGIYLHSCQTRSVVLDYGAEDTMLTAPLSLEQRVMLANWFARGAPQGVFFSALEVGVRLSATTNAAQVHAFLRNCPLTSA